MSLPSPTSPQEGLRRRGRQGAGDEWPGESSTSHQPVSPVHLHHRTISSTSDSFGDFIDSNQYQNIEEHKMTPSGSFDDGWQAADLVQSFSPVAAAGNDVAQKEQVQPASTSADTSAALNALDWDAWETPRGPSPQPNATTGASTKVDQNFLAAFEKASITQQQRPSPPMIDLRDMERKLEKQKQIKAGLLPSDLDFFESFEKRPGQVMMNSREKAESNASLKGPQLDNMTDAQASPMNIVTPGGKGKAAIDYFGDNRDLMMDSPDGSRARNEPETPSSLRSDSWSETAGHWAGTFRKTLGTLRGQAAELAQHLPSSKDFIVPEGEQEEDSDGAEENGRYEEMAAPIKSPARRIARASDHSQSSPFGTSSGTSPPRHHLARNSINSVPILHSPIKGAPGFAPNTFHNWNTGSWSLSSTEETQRNKKPIPVQLKGRREETQDVVGEELAAHLTAHLPKRLQLGKTWKLLYSSDQHGISLGTLYWKVQSGLEMGRQTQTAGISEAEGWLRGASQATQEAVTGVKRVGGGLNLSDAGLILAIRDSEDRVFGTYVNERLRPQTSYYGNGECFLWKAAGESEVKTFKWTGSNDYMILTEAHYLSFGGGDGKYGLWLDGQLEKGISSKCPAFNNEVLCSADETLQEGNFECITLEVWACGID